ncbi:MAG: hypothetical protein JWM74_2942 [Myxococcaceae bacterium]|nr:hypothetical protein [Myxococcaceae bacterium]
MFAVVLKNVNERVADGAWTRELACVVALWKDLAAPAQRSVDAVCSTHRETTHASSELARVLCFDEQVQMVVLYGKLDHAKRVGRGTRDGLAHPRERELGAKATDARAHRDVQGVVAAVLRTCAVRHAALGDGRLPACARALAAPRSRLKIER